MDTVEFLHAVRADWAVMNWLAAPISVSLQTAVAAMDRLLASPKLPATTLSRQLGGTVDACSDNTETGSPFIAMQCKKRARDEDTKISAMPCHKRARDNDAKKTFRLTLVDCERTLHADIEKAIADIVTGIMATGSCKYVYKQRQRGLVTPFLVLFPNATRVAITETKLLAVQLMVCHMVDKTLYGEKMHTFMRYFVTRRPPEEENTARAHEWLKHYKAAISALSARPRANLTDATLLLTLRGAEDDE